MKKGILFCFLCSILGMSGMLQAQKDSTHFVTTWKTTNIGVVGDSSIYINVDPNYTYNYDVDWNNDGIFDTLGVTTSIVHQYPDTGTYTVRIKGIFPGVSMRGLNGSLYVFKLIALEQWGTTVWTRLDSAFYGAINMQYNAQDVPNITAVSDLRYLFFQNFLFNGNLSNWNVSNITNMESMFYACFVFNNDISGWDVSNVTDMSSMFIGVDMSFSLDVWNVSAVTKMDQMFQESAYNQPLNSWDVSSVTTMHLMFLSSNFNQALNNWDVSSVTDMGSMFGRADFNQPIDNWDVSNAMNMRGMFSYSTAFNQAINSWDVSSVANMEYMFYETRNFDQPLDNWNVSNVTNMNGMFIGAYNFNQSLSSWDVSNVTTFANAFDSTALSLKNYDDLLTSWSAQNVKNGVPFGAAGLDYCLGNAARIHLQNNFSWTFTGDTLDCLTVGVEEALAESNKEVFKVYPNPSEGRITLELEKLNQNSELLYIYNTKGQLMQTERITALKQELDLSSLKRGLYVLKFASISKRVVLTE
ncbi:MAG: BspA family leucine-rich repeat surface protein [Flavobacteriales bacterium]|nr:BspA family leucine-rich repeat surface protein [Flavobacteriales bacterium]